MSKRVQRVWNGKVIDGLKSVVMGRKKSAEVIACVNALLSWEVKSGQKTCGEIQISDAKTTLLLPKGGSITETSVSGGLKQCQITELFSKDYIGVKLYNTSGTGTQFLVAKSIPGRMPESDTVDGVEFSYTYTDDNTRQSNDGSTIENQKMFQRFVVGKIVYVAAVDHSGVFDGDDVEILWIEVNTAREWVKPNVG